MADLGTKLSLSASGAALGVSTNASLEDIITGASGDPTKALYGDGSFKTPGGGGVPRFLPFFGDTTLLWQRPSLDIGGPSNTFNTRLNFGSIAVLPSATNNFNYNGPGTGPPAAPGTGYVPGDTITLPGSHPTILNLTDTQVVFVAVAGDGSGGTPGAATLTGTTGSGTMFQCTVVIQSDGTLTGAPAPVLTVPGDYTTNPTSLSAEPVTSSDGGPLTGCTVHLVMGALAANLATPGLYSVIPTNPVGQASTTGSGTGATWDMTYNALPMATDNPGGGPLVITAGNAKATGGANADLVGLLTPARAPPWTITVGVAAANTGSGGAGTVAPIILFNSTDQVAVTLEWAASSSEAYVYHYLNTAPSTTSPTAIGSNITLSQTYFMWFRITNDGTTLRFFISYENLLYLQIYEEAADALVSSFDYVGYGIAPDGFNFGAGGNAN